MVDTMASFGTNMPNDFEESTVTNYVHIRMQQRNKRKCLTIIEGIPEDIDLKKILRYFKKTYSCNGTIVNNEENNEKIIQLTGDKRDEVAEFLQEEGIVPEDCIKVHGH